MQWLTRIRHHNSLVSLISSLSFLIILGTTLLSLTSYFAWNLALEIFSHFKIQYLTVSLILFSLLLLTRQKRLIIASLFCLSIIFSQVLPSYIPQVEIQGNLYTNLKILSSNLNVKNSNYSKILSLIKQEQPDIVVLMEINQRWVNQLNSLEPIFPYSIVNANPYNLGIAVYSQRKLENPSIELFGIPKNPSIVGKLTIDGQVISLVATHPPPPKPTLFEARNQQLDQISQYIKLLTTPVVVVGDFNITMWSPYYQKFVANTGLENARKGFGILPTWPQKTTYPPYSRIPSFLLGLGAIPIDHCLISPDMKVKHIRTGSNVGSDHRPLIIELMVPKAKSN